MIKYQIYQTYPNLELRKKLLSKNSVMNNLKNDYNVKFLPYTQFVKMKLTKKKLIFKKEYYSKLQHSDPSISYSQWGTFFIETYKNKLLISDFLGKVVSPPGDPALKDHCLCLLSGFGVFEDFQSSGLMIIIWT